MLKRYQICVFALLSAPLFAEEKDPRAITHHSQPKPAVSHKDKKTMVWFRYKDEPIINIVNELAKKRGINIMPAQGANALTAKLTFELPHKITLSKAWQYIITILDMAGFTIIPNPECSLIVKNDSAANKESLPFYVGVSPQELPNTDLKIRYLRYLTFLQVPSSGGSGGSSSLQTLFSQMLSPSYAVIYQPQLNAVLVTDTARNIKSVMTIVDELDASSPVELPEFIELKYNSASNVKTLLTSLVSGASQSQTNNYGAAPAATPSPGGSYFASGTKIVAIDRLNTLVVIGKKDAVLRIKDFVKKYIDLPPENGQSILHVYTLKYLKAENFAPILTQIVQNQSSSGGGGGYGTGTGQSSSSGGGGEFRQFQGVKITAESSSSGGGGSYGGGQSSNPYISASVQGGSQTGNRLIIAALRDDWIRIEKLIKELDKPQLQVIVHGLIVDLSYTALKDFANQVRNHSGLFMRDINWQTGHIAGIENGTTASDSIPTDAGALQANLLSPDSTNYSGTGTGNIASDASAGSFIMSFKDVNTNGIWWISTILGSHTDSKVLSQPFLMTMNNKEVTFVDSVTRRLAGAANEQYGVEVRNQEDVSASINLTILPRINENGRINLSLAAQVNQFTGTDNAQLTRNVTTNVNLYDKDILILGGLTKTKVENSVYKTPILGDIPIVGNLFKKRNKVVTKTNLMIFLRPEIVRLNDDAVTNRYFDKATKLLAGGEENFGFLRDPITRWFFDKDPKGVSPAALDDFRHIVEPLPPELKKAPPLPAPEKFSSEAERKPLKEEPKKPKPSTQAPISPDIEEQQAEEELKKLFAWDKKEVDQVDSEADSAASHESIHTVDLQEEDIEESLKSLLDTADGLEEALKDFKNPTSTS